MKKRPNLPAGYLMLPDPLWQTSAFEKELRAGKELSTQSVT
jgi:hypothetical protein